MGGDRQRHPSLGPHLKTLSDSLFDVAQRLFFGLALTDAPPYGRTFDYTDTILILFDGYDKSH